MIDPFCREVRAGRTPNPCLACNTSVKYRELLRRAEQFGATHLATGHYRADGISTRPFGAGCSAAAADPRKDQSYALYGLQQEQLAQALFPLGELSKSETRAGGEAGPPDREEAREPADLLHPGR